jgi:hypothetical protein
VETLFLFQIPLILSFSMLEIEGFCRKNVDFGKKMEKIFATEEK